VRNDRAARALLRHFFFRFFDQELMAAQGDLRQTMIHIVALLGALNFLVALGMTFKQVFRTGELDYAARRAMAWSDQEILISLTLTAAGLMTVFIWDSLFPDRRDCLVLASLPVRMRAVFLARSAALASALGVIVVSVNAFTGLVIPVVLLPPGAGIVDLAGSLLAYWAVMLAAGAFVFLSLIAVQGALVQLLPHRWFQRASGYAQLIAFFAIVSVLFLTPSLANPRALAAAENQALLAAIPSMWFLGLYEWMRGAREPVFQELAGRAAAGLLLSLVAVVFTYGLGYARHVRNIVEQPEAAPSRARRSLAMAWAARLLMRRPLERAIFHFIARTLARSRQHRLLVAIYCGVGLAYTLSAVSRLMHGRNAGRWFQPTPELLGASLDFLFFLLVGLRVAMAIPVELKANWVFRITERADPRQYLAAVRKAMLALGAAPVCLVALPVYGLLWGWWMALGHGVFAVLVSMVLIEALTGNFRKIPFACSYLPGRANLKVMFGVYWGLFLFFSSVAATMEISGLRQPGLFLRQILLLAGALAVLRWRRDSRFHFVFEETPEPVVTTLQLDPRLLRGG